MRAFLVATLVLLAVLMPHPSGASVPMLDPERGVMTTAPLLDKTTPAVVNIAVIVRVPMRQNPLFSDPFFRRFFDLPERPPEREALSAGSGVIVDAENGYVMTNNHVIENADRISVTLRDRRVFDAQLVGTDPETDIAILKIDAKDLTSIPFADSDDLRVGDVVFAIGNPFGLGQTVTSGIISALGRGIGMHGYEDFIQTDAPINPGNSGGALVNTKGELIGINSAIIGPAGGNVGIGFAAPSNMARAVMDQLVAYGKVTRGWLGVSVQDLTPDLAEALGAGHTQGAVITDVTPDSAAEEAGVRQGDVVIALNDHSIHSGSDLRNKIGLIRPGGEARLTVLRDGKELSISARVSEVGRKEAKGEEIVPQLAGALLSDIPPDHPAYGQVEGVLVAEVETGSVASRYGLRADDIIVAVNRTRVKSLDEFVAAAEQAERVLALNLLRGNARLLIVIQ